MGSTPNSRPDFSGGGALSVKKVILLMLEGGGDEGLRMRISGPPPHHGRKPKLLGCFVDRM